MEEVMDKTFGQCPNMDNIAKLLSHEAIANLWQRSNWIKPGNKPFYDSDNLRKTLAEISK